MRSGKQVLKGPSEKQITLLELDACFFPSNFPCMRSTKLLTPICIYHLLTYVANRGR